MQTTLQEFAKMADTKELRPSEREVLFALKQLGRASMKDVSNYLGKALNRISGRFSELERKQCIVKVGKNGRFTEYEAVMWPSEG